MSMNFKNQSRPNIDVINNLAKNNTPFKKVLFPNEPENFQEHLGSLGFEKAITELEEYNGYKGVINENVAMALMHQGMTYLTSISNLENGKEKALEELCEKMVVEYFHIPNGALQFNLKIVKDGVKTNKESSSSFEENNEDEEPKFIVERAKRRIINSLTQGLAVNCTYLYNDYKEDVIKVIGNEEIINYYSKFIPLMMLNYWLFSDEMLKTVTNESDAAGKVKIDTTTTPPTINAESVNFPFLVHETVKGVMEYFGKEKNPIDIDVYNQVLKLEDKVEHETWDIRFGPSIWNMFYSLLPNTIKDAELQYYIYVNIVNLPANEFLLMFREILGNTPLAKTLIGALYYDLIRRNDNEEITKDNSEFKMLMSELVNNNKDFEFALMLKELGF